MTKALLKPVSIIVALAMLILTTACGNTPAASTHTSTLSSTPAGEVVDTAKNTLTVAIDREPVSLDPPDASVNVKRNIESSIYDTLLKFDEKMVPVPHLAESYKRIDELTWEFKLRKGVSFHNGDPLTANDVVFTFKRQHNLATGKENVSAFDPAGYAAPDNNTFILKTLKPYAFTEQQLCSVGLGIMNEKAVTAVGKDTHARAPIGTGPYKFSAWTPGSSITVVRNDGYWGEKAKMQTIVFRIITEAATRTIELEAGGIDINLTLANTDSDRIDQNPATKLMSAPSTTMRYIAFNTQKAPLNDIKVRQALYHATNVKLISEIVYGAPKSATTAIAPVPPALPGANPDLPQYAYDPAKAKAMLTQAGHASGLSVEFMYLPGAANDMLVQMLQEMWKEAGVTLVLKPMESAALTAALNAGEHQVCSAGTSMGLNDAGDGLNKFFHSKNMNTSAARSNLNVKEIDEALNKISSTLDSAPRIPLVYEAQKLIHAQAPLIYICHTSTLVGTSDKVRGFVLPTNGIYNFANVYLVK